MPSQQLLRMRDYATKGQAEVWGWLQPSAAMMIWGLLERQLLDRITGDVMEIGVYEGRTFLLLCQSLAEGERAIAIDPFQMPWPDGEVKSFKQYFLANLQRHAPTAEVEIIEGTSDHFRSHPLRQSIKGRVRFLAIDGSHERDDVVRDLELADECLSPDGLLAVDDFMSPYNPDVTTAVVEFLDGHANTDLVPIAICQNSLPMLENGGPKLFLSRAARADYYSNGMDLYHPGVGDKTPNFCGHTVKVSAFESEPFKRRIADYDQV